MKIYPIPNGYYCVPSAICALTGAEPEAVIVPAINRAERAESLITPPAGVAVAAAETVLRELGYNVRRYKKSDIRARLFTWAKRSAERYPGRSFLVTTSGRPGHAVVILDGMIYDNHVPVGAAAREHPFSTALVDYVALVEEA